MALRSGPAVSAATAFASFGEGFAPYVLLSYTFGLGPPLRLASAAVVSARRSLPAPWWSSYSRLFKTTISEKRGAIVEKLLQ
eukprot:2254531-Pleurochrysis_carterae.AAC.1